jgi:hypothetical protein
MPNSPRKPCTIPENAPLIAAQRMLIRGRHCRLLRHRMLSDLDHVADLSGRLGGLERSASTIPRAAFTSRSNRASLGASSCRRCSYTSKHGRPVHRLHFLQRRFLHAFPLAAFLDVLQCGYAMAERVHGIAGIWTSSSRVRMGLFLKEVPQEAGTPQLHNLPAPYYGQCDEEGLHYQSPDHS